MSRSFHLLYHTLGEVNVPCKHIFASMTDFNKPMLRYTFSEYALVIYILFYLYMFQFYIKTPFYCSLRLK